MTVVDDVHAVLPERALRAQDKARVLREALPWITRWADRTVVIKIGGSVGQGETPGAMEAAFAADVALLRSVGLKVVVVHGGGPQISQLADRLGLDSQFVDGRRVTDRAMLEAVRYVLLGQVNPRLVGLITQAGARAAGVAGTDAQLITARQSDPALGFVGDIDAVDPSVLRSLLADDVVPVVATVARGTDGQDYNVNADTVAAAVASALAADKLIYLTDVAGIYRHYSDRSSLISRATPADLEAIVAAGGVTEGMLPKVEGCLEALCKGVASAHILDGSIPHALLVELLTEAGVGTMITEEEQ